MTNNLLQNYILFINLPQQKTKTKVFFYKNVTKSQGYIFLFSRLEVQKLCIHISFIPIYKKIVMNCLKNIIFVLRGISTHQMDVKNF